MRDGRTHKLAGSGKGIHMKEFLRHFRARIVAVSGGGAGAEICLDRVRLTIGRGPGVDVAFQDTAMSRQHCAVEYTREGFRIQDLGSTNGLTVNGRPVQVVELHNGDRFQVGNTEFQLVVEEREADAEVYELSTGI